MNRVVVVALAAAAAGCAVIGMGILALLGGGIDTSANAAAGGTECTVAGSAQVPGLTVDQERNATAIVVEGQRLNVPAKGLVVAVAVGYTESGLRNLASEAVPESFDYPNDGGTPGDHDSVGLMQQRGSWGTVEQRMTPSWSAKHFYVGGSTKPDGWHEPGLLDTPGWQTMTVTEAAQAVQVSAYPDAYAVWADDAEAVVESITGQTVTTGCDGEGADPAADVHGPWTVPLPDGYVFSVDSFGACGSLWDNCHTGVDLSGQPAGTPIYAAHAGTVESAGFVGTSLDPSYGWLVTLNHGHGIVTYYAHQVERPPVHVGDTVKAGQVIGHVGDTGNATGVHLHYEVRRDGVPIDPVPFMADHGAPL